MPKKHTCNKFVYRFPGDSAYCKICGKSSYAIRIENARKFYSDPNKVVKEIVRKTKSIPDINWEYNRDTRTLSISSKGKGLDIAYFDMPDEVAEIVIKELNNM
jgi:hypothetical protein